MLQCIRCRRTARTRRRARCTLMDMETRGIFHSNRTSRWETWSHLSLAWSCRCSSRSAMLTDIPCLSFISWNFLVYFFSVVYLWLNIFFLFRYRSLVLFLYPRCFMGRNPLPVIVEWKGLLLLYSLENKNLSEATEWWWNTSSVSNHRLGTKWWPMVQPGVSKSLTQGLGAKCICRGRIGLIYPLRRIPYIRKWLVLGGILLCIPPYIVEIKEPEIWG